MLINQSCTSIREVQYNWSCIHIVVPKFVAKDNGIASHAYNHLNLDRCIICKMSRLLACILVFMHYRRCCYSQKATILLDKDVAIHKSNYTATLFHVAINKRQLYRFPILVTKVRLAWSTVHATFSAVVFFPRTPPFFLSLFPPPCPASLVLLAVVTFFLFTLALPPLVAVVITTGLAVGWLD